ncbi:hypothetical protein [Leptospira stimsonii]|uniref:Hemerythrin-like domain-containing protein n=1 Tax=Leptospira stimsonii TaxID=2202203 RepID=A0A4R9L8B1_9LEPT|nr:hypothetical protein [Leptospira stimsonii]RHX88516.1 hypothetical protein DLM78_06140 [Leptospira stimsonii]TGK22988.1 hypothetical protein EHO98_06890 [Leptospira stimsonii]TGM16579.1 hypothetical protein EHQ90_09375 [Leptospira stimsonii]
MQVHLYQKQNEVLKKLVIELIRILRTDSVLNRVGEVHDILAILNARLNEHLRTEEGLILLDLLPEETLLEEGNEFCSEQNRNELKNRIRQYITKWSLPSLIQESPSSFIKDSNEIMDTLYIRLQSEIELLFPILNQSYFVSEKIG